MHYHRLWRNGTLVPVKHFIPKIDSSGYLTANGERIHRLVFRLKNRNKAMQCWNCEKSLSWDMGKRFHIDHIDQNKLNNKPDNLRASCFQCNVQRTSQKTMITHGDVTKSADEWAEDRGVWRATLMRRIKKHGVEKALTMEKVTHKAGV